MVNRVGRVFFNHLGKGFRQNELSRVPNCRLRVNIKTADDCNSSGRFFSQISRQIRVLKLAVKLHGINLFYCRQRADPVLSASVTDGGGPHFRLVDIFFYPVKIMPLLSDFMLQIPQDSASSVGQRLKAEHFRLHDMLVLRFSEVEAVVINIVLRYRIDQIGNVPVIVDVFTNSGRTDILQMNRQCQFYDPSGNILVGFGQIVLFFLPYRRAFPPEHNMIEGMNRVL